jgi:hypothetical protein
MALQPFVGPLPLLQFRNHLYTDGRIPWTGDQPVARPLPTHRTTQTQNKHTETSMPWVGFEPTIPAFERAKTVHALDAAATVIGWLKPTRIKFPWSEILTTVVMTDYMELYPGRQNSSKVKFIRLVTIVVSLKGWWTNTCSCCCQPCCVPVHPNHRSACPQEILQHWQTNGMLDRPMTLSAPDVVNPGGWRKIYWRIPATCYH